MAERYSGAQGGPDKEIDRREFLKILGVGAAGTLVGTAVGSELLDSASPERHEEAVGRIVAFSTRKDSPVPAGGGTDNFFYGSGWEDEGYSSSTYRDALKLVNKETHPKVDINNLLAEQEITVLIKPKENKE